MFSRSQFNCHELGGDSQTMTHGCWVLPLWCINIEEAKPLNLLPFHFDNFPMRSEFLRKLKKIHYISIFTYTRNQGYFYGLYLSRDDNEGRQVHECIQPLRHYQKLTEILSKSPESEIFVLSRDQFNERQDPDGEIESFEKSIFF